MATVVQYNKYERLKKQVSYDNGTTWTDVEPAEYEKGNLIEVNSRDCGYNLVYQWDNQVINDSIVSVEKISYNDGNVWRPTGEIKVNGQVIGLDEAVAEYDGLDQYISDMDAAADDYVDSIENNSGSESSGSEEGGSDSGGDEDPDPSESEDNSYLSVYLYQKWVKHSGQSNFVPKWPLEYSIEGDHGETTTRSDHDPECGYTPPFEPIYRWIVDGYLCVEETVEVTTQYRWIDSGKYICLNGDKYSLLKRQKSEDGGITWTDVEPAEYRRGTLIETASVDCANRLSVDYYLQSGNNTLALDRGGRVEAVWVDGDNIDFTGQNITFNAPSTARYHVDFAISGSQVPSYMFALRTELDTVSIPSKFTNIGYYAFQNCTNLRDLTIEGVQTINIGAFEGCHNIVHLEFPATLVSIDDEAFSGCQSLEELTFNGDIPPMINDRTFYNCPLTQINVTQAAYDYFINDQIWSQYASIIRVMN